MADSAWWVARVRAPLACVALAWVVPRSLVWRGVAAFADAGFLAAFARGLAALGKVVLAVGIWKGSPLSSSPAARDGYVIALMGARCCVSDRTPVCNPLGRDRYRDIVAWRENPVTKGHFSGLACNRRRSEERRVGK